MEPDIHFHTVLKVMMRIQVQLRELENKHIIEAAHLRDQHSRLGAMFMRHIDVTGRTKKRQEREQRQLLRMQEEERKRKELDAARIRREKETEIKKQSALQLKTMREERARHLAGQAKAHNAERERIRFEQQEHEREREYSRKLADNQVRQYKQREAEKKAALKKQKEAPKPEAKRPVSPAPEFNDRVNPLTKYKKGLMPEPPNTNEQSDLSKSWSQPQYEAKKTWQEMGVPKMKPPKM